MDTMSADVTGRPAASPADARHRARLFLDSLARPLTPEAAESVVLVVSELVTNALRHGGGLYTLALTPHPDSIEVAVRGPQPARPADAHPGPERW